MTPIAILPGMGYSDPVIADTMVVSFEARGLCFNPFSGNPCVGLGEQIPRAFCRLLSRDAGWRKPERFPSLQAFFFLLFGLCGIDRNLFMQKHGG